MADTKLSVKEAFSKAFEMIRGKVVTDVKLNGTTLAKTDGGVDIRTDNDVKLGAAINLAAYTGDPNIYIAPSDGYVVVVMNILSESSVIDVLANGNILQYRLAPNGTVAPRGVIYVRKGLQITYRQSGCNIGTDSWITFIPIE